MRCTSSGQLERDNLVAPHGLPPWLQRVWRVFAGTAVRRLPLGVNFRVSIIDSTVRSTTLSPIWIFVADFFRYPEIVVIAPTTFYSRVFLYGSEGA